MIRKLTTILLVLSLVFGKPAGLVVLANELENNETEIQSVSEGEVPESLDSTPLEGPSEEFEEEEESEEEEKEENEGITDEADVENNVESTANTGENEITTKDCLETEEPSESEIPDNCTEADPPEEELLVESTEDTKDENKNQSEEEEGVESSDGDEGEIETDDALSVTEIENEVNYTEVDSTVQMHTLNIFTSGDVKMSFDPWVVADKIFGDIGYTEPVTNVAIYEGGNYAILENDVHSVANTGDNYINTDGDSVVTTGDAYSLVNLLNKVNTTIIGSTLHIVSINIYGEVHGDIILPEGLPDVGKSSCCIEDLSTSNEATVVNNVVSHSNTGENSVIQTDEDGESQIQTGDAQSVVNVSNLINRTLVDVDFFALYVNNLGTWLGEFVGWNDVVDFFGTWEGSSNSDCQGCVGGVNQTNQALVTNNISSLANTGGNSSESGSSTITTGNAYSVVNLINIINSTIINSRGFIGFINIFGTLAGDIGGESKFEADPAIGGPGFDSNESPKNKSANHSEGDGNTRETGGELEVYQTNNVNDHVYPGDTVTFSAKVQNPGSGKVYGVILVIDLYKDGEMVGGAEFELGDIDSRKSIKVITGMTLSDQIAGGPYAAHAYAFGTVGPDESEVSGYADSFFRVVGNYTYYTPNTIVSEVKAGNDLDSGMGEVLGASTKYLGKNRKEEYMYAALGILLAYISGKFIYKRRDRLVYSVSRVTEMLR